MKDIIEHSVNEYSQARIASFIAVTLILVFILFWFVFRYKLFKAKKKSGLAKSWHLFILIFGLISIFVFYPRVSRRETEVYVTSLFSDLIEGVRYIEINELIIKDKEQPTPITISNIEFLQEFSQALQDSKPGEITHLYSYSYFYANVYTRNESKIELYAEYKSKPRGSADFSIKYANSNRFPVKFRNNTISDQFSRILKIDDD